MGRNGESGDTVATINARSSKNKVGEILRTKKQGKDEGQMKLNTKRMAEEF